MLQWMAPQPCTYGQLIGLSGLLETRRRVAGGGARGGGNNGMSRRRCWGKGRYTWLYFIAYIMKFSKNRKEKNIPDRTSIGMEVFGSTSEERKTSLFLKQFVTLNLSCDV